MMAEGAWRVGARGEHAVRITDAQVHLWQKEGGSRPWAPDGRVRAREHGLGPMAVEQVLALMDGAGVQRAVLVPPTFAGAYNDICLEAARDHPERLAVMGHVGAEGVRIAQVLRGWRDAPGMLGVRLSLSRGAARTWFGDGILDTFWRAAESEGIPVYVLAPDLQEAMGAVARRYPELRIIIDHLSIRTGVRGIASLPGVEALLKLASAPNVAVKASCVAAYSDEEYPYRGMQTVVKRVVDAFGPQRVFWGSDMSRLPGPYLDAVTLFTEEMDFLSSEDLEWIMGRGLGEWLGWP